MSTEAAILVDTPIGALRVVAGPDGLTHIRLPDSNRRPLPATPVAPSAATRHAAAAACALEEYFAGARKGFADLTLAPSGTAFQQRVWRALSAIPFGETRSYAEVARGIRAPLAARAVGMANHRNPLAIIVPCHRVIGADGRLTGYAGGLDRKRWLLAHEATVAPRPARGTPPRAADRSGSLGAMA